MALHLLYLFLCWVYHTAWLCLYAISKFIAAKSTSWYRFVLKKLTLCYVITLGDKTVAKNISCAVMVKRQHKPICFSVLNLKIILHSWQEMCGKCAYAVDANVFPMWTRVSTLICQSYYLFICILPVKKLQHWVPQHNVQHQVQQLLDLCEVLFSLYLFSTFQL